MNPSALAALLIDDLELVSVRFKDVNGELKGKLYSYKVAKEWECEPGDTLVVDSPFVGLTCVVIDEVKGPLTIDTNAPYSYKWAVCKVDLTEHKAQLAREEKFLKHIEEAQTVARKRQAIEALFEGVEGVGARTSISDAIEELNGRPVAPSAQPAPAPHRARARAEFRGQASWEDF